MGDVITSNAVSHWLGASLESALPFGVWDLWLQITDSIIARPSVATITQQLMMTSLRGNDFRITGLLLGGSTGFPSQRINNSLLFPLLLVWTCYWIKSRIAGDFRSHDARVTSLLCLSYPLLCFPTNTGEFILQMHRYVRWYQKIKYQRTEWPSEPKTGTLQHNFFEITNTYHQKNVACPFPHISHPIHRQVIG